MHNHHSLSIKILVHIVYIRRWIKVMFQCITENGQLNAFHLSLYTYAAPATMPIVVGVVIIWSFESYKKNRRNKWKLHATRLIYKMLCSKYFLRQFVNYSSIHCALLILKLIKRAHTGVLIRGFWIDCLLG